MKKVIFYETFLNLFFPAVAIYGPGLFWMAWYGTISLWILPIAFVITIPTWNIVIALYGKALLNYKGKKEYVILKPLPLISSKEEFKVQKRKVNIKAGIDKSGFPLDKDYAYVLKGFRIALRIALFTVPSLLIILIGFPMREFVLPILYEILNVIKGLLSWI
mgnify:CR=1 FL=1